MFKYNSGLHQASTTPRTRKTRVEMNEVIAPLQHVLAQRQFENFLNAMAVYAIQRAYDKEAQGLLTGSSTLDALCCQAAEAIERDDPMPAATAGTDDFTLYIATELYWGKGGHTPLLMDLIKVDRSARRELVLTNINGGPKTSEFKQQLSQALGPSVKAHYLEAESLLEKILILRAYIRAQRPRRIILMTHQHDVVSYCGLTGGSARQIIKVLHADTFSLGLNIPWYMLVTLNAISAQDIANDTGRGVHLWPIAAEDQGMRPWREWEAGGPLKTCSHGTQRKFDGQAGLTYADVVAQRLQLLPGEHVHIGDLNEEMLHQIRATIARAGLAAERFSHVGSVPSLWRYLKASDIQLCISSFPVCGPRGLVETKGCGLPVLMYENREHPVRSSLIHAYPGCLHWSTEQELVAAYRALTPAVLREQALLARADYERNHSMEALGTKARIPDNYVAPKVCRPAGTLT
ncbi:hypothetical protein ACG04R_22450 [Roseateles sp. BYS78W]|uniref:Glycosyltransferase family 1 protein n=1 Tax=Pelomonas candidula TaxID=3299025 RepID=A0ABW7HHU5_9BURK